MALAQEEAYWRGCSTRECHSRVQIRGSGQKTAGIRCLGYATIYWDKTRKQLEPQVALFERMMFEQDRALQEKVKALPEEGREEAATRLLNDQTASFFSMVSGKWRELKGRVLEIFVRSM